MQKQQLTWNVEPAIEIAIHPIGKPAPACVPAERRERQRRLRVALPSPPRRQSCVTRRAMLAALREAELADWQASGGDYLHAPRPN